MIVSEGDTIDRLYALLRDRDALVVGASISLFFFSYC